MTAGLGRDFYARPTLEVARDLLGKVLVHATRAGRAAGRIVEVEAYIGEDDPACHAASGPTRRNLTLYGRPGLAYVYVSYGLHYLTNAVTEAEGVPAAVLIRALEPVEGLPLMRTRRARGASTPGDSSLCRGPGNLARALGIDLTCNGTDLCAGRLHIEDRGGSTGPIARSSRIGIRAGTDRPWRLFLADSAAVSGSRRPRGASRPAGPL